jgi:hypothetical protein
VRCRYTNFVTAGRELAAELRVSEHLASNSKEGLQMMLSFLFHRGDAVFHNFHGRMGPQPKQPTISAVHEVVLNYKQFVCMIR